MRQLGLCVLIACGPPADTDTGPVHDCAEHRTAFRAIDPMPMVEEWDPGDTCDQRTLQPGSLGCSIFFREPTISLDCTGTDQEIHVEAAAIDTGPLHCGASFDWEDRTLELSLRQEASLVVWDLAVTDAEGSCPYRFRYSP